MRQTSMTRFVETDASKQEDAHSALRVVLRVSEIEELTRMRRELAEAKQLAKRLTARCNVCKRVMPALFADRGQALYHPRYDDNTLADDDIFEFVGTVEETNADMSPHVTKFFDLQHVPETHPRLDLSLHAHLIRNYLEADTYKDWIVFRQLVGTPLKEATDGGVLHDLVNAGKLPFECFRFYPPDCRGEWDKYCMVVPPELCGGFRVLDDAQFRVLQNWLFFQNHR